MKRRNKWILIVLLIGCSILGIAPVAYFGYFAVWAMHDLKRMEAHRQVLLYETDHRALLEACRELSRQVAAGELKPGRYNTRYDINPETGRFPQLILNLAPLHVDVEKDGQIDLTMSPVVMYGVCAFPEDYKRSRAELFRSGEKVWGIELIDGLWYYDEDFLRHPEHKKEVEELLKKRKAGNSSGVL